MKKTFFAFLALLLLAASPAFAQTTTNICVLEGPGNANNPACPTRGGGTSAYAYHAFVGPNDLYSAYGYSFTPAAGARINRTVDATTPIDAWGYCRYVKNLSTTQDFFIPFRTDTEWASFRNHAQSGSPNFQLTHCARPVDGQYSSLYYGPSGKRDDVSPPDQGEKTHPVSGLPYARTGSAPFSPPNYTFNNSCYEEYSESHCFFGHWETVQDPQTYHQETVYVDPCAGCQFWGCFTCQPGYYTTISVPDPPTYHQEWRCDQSGTICRSRWNGWQETFSFTGSPLDSDNGEPSWTGSSSKLGGSRPDGPCAQRCTQNGYNCDCGGTPNGPSSSCTVPGELSFGACPVYVCSTYMISWNGCALSAVLVLISRNKVDALVAAGDTCSAKNERDQMNNAIRDLNNNCSALFGFSN